MPAVDFASQGCVPLTWRDGLLAAGLAVLTVVSGAGRLSVGGCGMFHDDGVYVATAKALAGGQGYRLINLPGAPAQTKYPILYPAVLAALWTCWPDFPANLMLLEGASLAFGAASVAMAFLYLVRFGYCGRGAAAAAAALGALSYAFLYFCVHTMSETLFALLVTVALWGLEAQARMSESGRMRQFGLGLLLAAPFHCRTIGAVLPLAGWLTLRRGKRPAFWTAIGSLAAMAPWIVWTRVGAAWSDDPVVGYYTDYVGWWAGLGTFANLFRIVACNANEILRDSAGLGLDGFPFVARLLGLDVPWRWLFLGAGVVGWAFAIQRAWIGRPLATFLVLYAALCCVWPWPPLRFLVPLLPFLLAFVLGGLAALARRLIGRGARASGWCLVALALFGSVLSAIENTQKARRHGFDSAVAAPRRWEEYEEIFAWLRARAKPSDLVACGSDTLIFLHTGLQAFRPFVHRPAALFYGENGSGVGPPDEVAAILRGRGARYLVLLEDEPALEAAVDQLLRQDPGWLTLAHQSADKRFRVFEVATRRK